MSDSEKDLVKEIWEHRDDPEEWGEEEDIEVRPRRSSVLSFRLPPEELVAIEQAMAQTGESLSEFIRKALTMRLRGSPVERPTVELTYGGADEVVVGVVRDVLMGSPTTASYVPKRPPIEEPSPLRYMAGT